jgi:hypothetical protein
LRKIRIQITKSDLHTYELEERARKANELDCNSGSQLVAGHIKTGVPVAWSLFLPASMGRLGKKSQRDFGIRKFAQTLKMARQFSRITCAGQTPKPTDVLVCVNLIVYLYEQYIMQLHRI